MKKTYLTFGLLAFIGAGCASQPAPAPVPLTTTPAPSTIAASTTEPSPTASSTVTAPKAPTAPKTTVKKPVVPAHNTYYVSIKSTEFAPQIVATKAGDTVIWTNKDTKNHTVAAAVGTLFDSGNIVPGASFKHTFPAAGSYIYHDGTRPQVGGTIYVY